MPILSKIANSRLRVITPTDITFTKFKIPIHPKIAEIPPPKTSIIVFVSCKLLIPSQLTIEITENETIDSSKDLTQILNQLRRIGIRIAIDDFRAGYTGLNLFAEVQPELLKLDMNLIKKIHRDCPRQSIVRAIYSVCFDLGIDILAEGVEKIEDLQFLKIIGIDLY